MGLGKPTGFAAWVSQVWVQCQICQPTPTPYPSQVTCGFQPPVPTLAHAGGCICLAPPLTHTKVSPSVYLLPVVSHLPSPATISSLPPRASPHTHSLSPCCLLPHAISHPTPCRAHHLEVAFAHTISCPCHVEPTTSSPLSRDGPCPCHLKPHAASSLPP